MTRIWNNKRNKTTYQRDVYHFRSETEQLLPKCLCPVHLCRYLHGVPVPLICPSVDPTLVAMWGVNQQMEALLLHCSGIWWNHGPTGSTGRNCFQLQASYTQVPQLSTVVSAEVTLTSTARSCFGFWSSWLRGQSWLPHPQGLESPGVHVLENNWVYLLESSLKLTLHYILSAPSVCLKRQNQGYCSSRYLPVPAQQELEKTKCPKGTSTCFPKLSEGIVISSRLSACS